MRMEPRDLAGNKLKVRGKENRLEKPTTEEPASRGVRNAVGCRRTLFAETEAASEGEAGTEVPVLCAIRPDLSAGHTGRGVEAGARQSGSTRRGRRGDRTDPSAGSGRERVSRRDPGSTANQNLPAATSAPRLYTESQREDETTGNTDSSRSSGTDGDLAYTGADLRSRLRRLLLWAPSQPLGASSAGGDPHSSERGLSSRV